MCETELMHYAEAIVYRLYPAYSPLIKSEQIRLLSDLSETAQFLSFGMITTDASSVG